MSETQVSILVIEDDSVDAELVERLLIRCNAGYEITRVNCLEDAKVALANDDFEVVIADIGLPDCDRLEPVRYVREVYQSMAIIVLSGDSDERCYVEAIKAGADEFLCKLTLNRVVLQRSLQQSLQRVQEHETLRALISKVERQNSELESKSLELESKNKKLGVLCESSRVFVNHVSHEFRTPLCVIKQYASLISDAIVGPLNDEQIRMLNVIEDRVDGLNNLVDDMLDVSRHEAGLLSAKRNDYRVDEIIANEIDGLKQRASVRDIEIDVEIPSNLPSVFCDSEKTGRTLVNLVTNAIKYSPKGSRVRIAAVLDELSDAVRIEVQDEGAGIPEAKLASLFDHFKQETNSLQSETKGFGLGLGIAKELAELNLGEFSVASILGTGSTFSFTLPLNRTDAIVGKFIDYVRERPNRTSNELTLLKIEIKSEHSKRQMNAISAILSFVMRSNDLLLPSNGSTCLAILNSNEIGTQKFIERLNEELQESCRNCPGFEVPAIEPLVVEQLELNASSSSLVERISQHCETESMELSYA